MSQPARPRRTVHALRAVTLLLAVALPGALVAGTAAAAPGVRAPRPAAGVRAAAPVPGVGSVHDSLFPSIGNTGYDVGHYGIDLTYRTDRSITATTTVEAKTSKALSSFSFDLEGDRLVVDSVVVDGRRAGFRREAAKLLVTPARSARGRFTTTVRYHGTPSTHTDPDGAADGWVPSASGATVLSEPVGAQTWFPNNNTPRDKASFDVRVTAPKKLAVAGNGVLRSRKTTSGATTWHWQERSPMATYLAMISIGDFDVYHSTLRLRSGKTIPVWSFVEPKLGALKTQRALIGKIIAFSEREYGPYPFDSVGLVAQDLDVGYSLETQTRPFFDVGSAAELDEALMVHELAHQWYGDSVTPRDWGDIWLNEGFATYAEHNYDAAHGGPTTAQTFRVVYDRNPAGAALWSPAPAGLTDPADLFGEPVYTRGALTLDALRAQVGSADMTTILRRWSRDRRHGVASTAEFVALAERVSDRNLGAFFHAWLYVAAKPVGY